MNSFTFDLMEITCCKIDLDLKFQGQRVFFSCIVFYSSRRNDRSQSNSSLEEWQKCCGRCVVTATLRFWDVTFVFRIMLTICFIIWLFRLDGLQLWSSWNRMLVKPNTKIRARTIKSLLARTRPCQMIKKLFCYFSKEFWNFKKMNFAVDFLRVFPSNRSYRIHLWYFSFHPVCSFATCRETLVWKDIGETFILITLECIALKVRQSGIDFYFLEFKPDYRVINNSFCN